MEGASGRLSRSSGGCLRRRNPCAETVLRPEQQQQTPPPPPPRRCEAITCLIPVGKLAQANFSRLSSQEVSRTSRRLRGARARARSPARFPLPPSLPPPSLPASLPPALSWPASLLQPPPRGTKLRPEPLGRAVSSGRRGRAHALAQFCLRPPVSPLIPAAGGCGVGSDPGSPQPAQEPDHRRRSLNGMLSPLLG